MTIRNISIAVTAFFIGTIAVAAEASAIKVLSSPTLKTTLDDLTTLFERQTGHHLALQFDGVPVLKRQIEGGEKFDIAILLPAAIDDLVKQGKIGAATRVDIARTAAGIAIRAGAAKPNVASIDDLKRTLLAAESISYSRDSASGTYFLGLLVRLGIDAEVKQKLRPMTDRSPVDAVANGEADLTVITVPNIVGVKGVELGGLLPEEVQNYTTFSVGISTGAQEPRAADEFIKFLRTPAAISVVRARGLEPVVP
jgi:molybdate transport system substrate-binding protein